jgi:hypothetical protein
MYFSSSDGIRSGAPNVSYAARQPQYRVATVGDSFTFGLEVPFEAPWPNRLEQQLGPQTQILNFGVNAYGVDQAYLRYSRDVRPWRPDLVVLAFIQHDLYRSMLVYHFVSSSRVGLPVREATARRHRQNGASTEVPVPSPQEPRDTDLPFIEYDRGYDPIEWRWHAYYHSHLVRFVLSRFRRWPEQSADASIQAITLNGEIIHWPSATARHPWWCIFPARSDFLGIDRSVKNGVLTMLRGRRIRYEDLT